MKSSLFQQFRSDAKKESEGVPITFSPNHDQSVPTFFCSRMAQTNQKYVKALERITRPYKRQIQLQTLPNEKSDKIRMQVFIEAILQKWEHIQDENGNEISYSADAAMKLFEQLPELFFELETQAGNAALYRLEEVEADTKN